MRGLSLSALFRFTLFAVNVLSVQLPSSYIDLRILPAVFFFQLTSAFAATFATASASVYFPLTFLQRLCLLRKEVIQPPLPIRLPCYDFTPITKPTFDRVLQKVRLRASGVPGSHGVTGGVYKARERIHRGMLIRDY